MGFELGMPWLIEIEDMTQTIKICQKLNLSFIELNMNLPGNLPENLDARLLKILQRDTGIGFTIHMPDDLDLANFDSSIREGNVNSCKKTIEWAGVSGVELINMHINKGTYYTLPDKKVFVYERYEEEFLQNIITSYRQLTALAERYNVKLCIENADSFYLPYINKAISKLSQMKQIEFTYDIGHDAKCGYREKDIILSHVDKVTHMHLHDYDGTSDHLKLFSGNIDIKDMFNFARKKGISVVIEVKTLSALVDSVNCIQQLMREE